MPTHFDDSARVRAHSRVIRRAFTDVLKAHGVTDRGYIACTDGMYLEILGGRACQIRAANDLGHRANLRDHMDPVTLSLFVLAEHLAAARIEDEIALGNRACAETSVDVARTVRTSFAGIGKRRARPGDG